MFGVFEPSDIVGRRFNEWKISFLSLSGSWEEEEPK